MTRILFVTQTHNVWGGMEQWLHHFSRWLMEQGWDVFAALPRGQRFNDPQAYLEQHSHLRPVVIDVRTGSERARVLGLSEAIRSIGPDVVLPIASGVVFPAIALARSAGARARLVVPVRSLHPDLFCNVVDHLAVVDQVVAVSRLIESTLIALLPTERDRIHYVRHGVRPPRRSRQPADGLLRIGFVGRLEESTKRVLDLVPLRDELRRRRVNARIDIFGDGPDGERLMTALRSPEPDGSQVISHGALSQDELYERAYPELDVLVLFSPAEGSPNAVYEAMQHGVVPVIARYQGQKGERIVRDGETGLTFEVGDVHAAAAAIERLAADRSFLERLAGAAAGEVRLDTDVRMHRDWEAILRLAAARDPKPLPIGTGIALPPAGRIERVMPGTAAVIRRLLGREYRHPDGWSEWPGTEPASPACVARVLELLARLDREA